MYNFTYISQNYLWKNNYFYYKKYLSNRITGI